MWRSRLLAVLLGLGTWQIERKAWKEALIATLDQRRTTQPIALPPPVEWAGMTPDNSEFTRVRVACRVSAKRATRWSIPAARRSATTSKAPGYFVFSPARLPGGQQVVINRGFVPGRTYPQRVGPAGYRRRDALAGSAVVVRRGP